MLEIQYIRQSPQEVVKRLAIKNLKRMSSKGNPWLDEQKRGVQTRLDDVLAQLNKASKEIGDLLRPGKNKKPMNLKLIPLPGKKR